MNITDEYDITIDNWEPPKQRPIAKSGRPLADFMAKRRRQLGISLNELEARSGIHQSRLSRWERGDHQPRNAQRLIALARGLEVPAADLFVLVGVDIRTELPSLKPYLRAKYGHELPPEALRQIEEYASIIGDQYGINTGPEPGQDE